MIGFWTVGMSVESRSVMLDASGFISSFLRVNAERSSETGPLPYDYIDIENTASFSIWHLAAVNKHSLQWAMLPQVEGGGAAIEFQTVALP